MPPSPACMAHSAKFAGWRSIRAKRPPQLYGPRPLAPSDETLQACARQRGRHQRPLGPRPSGRHSSLNVALRQQPDLYVCQRPGAPLGDVPRHQGTRKDQHGDLSRKSEDIYAALNGCGLTPGPQTDCLFRTAGQQAHPFPAHFQALVSSRYRARARSAWCARPSSTPSTMTAPASPLVRKGNIMKFTEGAFRDWGYMNWRAKSSVRRTAGYRPWMRLKNPHGAPITIKDSITRCLHAANLAAPG